MVQSIHALSVIIDVYNAFSVRAYVSLLPYYKTKLLGVSWKYFNKQVCQDNYYKKSIK